MTTNEMADRMAIDHLVSGFVFHADRGEAAAVAGLFADDGVLEWVGVTRHDGPAAVVEWIESARAAFLASPTPSVRHHCSSVHVQLDGDRATVRSYWLAVTADGGPDHWGTYADVVVRTDAGWRFAHRRVRVDGHVPGSVSATTEAMARRHGGTR